MNLIDYFLKKLSKPLDDDSLKIDVVLKAMFYDYITFYFT